MNCPGRAVRLLPMVTVKAGGPIDPGERPGEGAARRGRRRRDDEADGGRGRLGAARLAQQEHRPARRLRAAMQAAGRGEVEPAADCRGSRV